MGSERVTILGIEFDCVTYDQACELIAQRLRSGEPFEIAFSNPEFVLEARRCPWLKRYINNCAFNLADGVGILYASKLLSLTTLPERITGTDFAVSLCQIAADGRHRVAFFGGTDGVAEQAADNMRKQIPGLDICGTFSGYEFDKQKIVEQLNRCSPDVIMVCLGNPLQEQWIVENRRHLNARLVFGNGGALDFLSGKVKRAPRIVRRMGFEWLYRLSQDFSLRRIRRQMKLPVFGARVLISVMSRWSV